MGNYVSCTLAGPGSKSLRAIMVIFPGGDIKELHSPIKAAELMLEKPNFFAVNSRSLHIGKRFSPLAADEELEFSNVYVMFPMKRFNSIITAADMGDLLIAANATMKKVSGGKARVLPEGCDNYSIDNSLGCKESSYYDMKDNEEVDEFSKPEFVVRRLSMSRSKKPMLETIVEEPIGSR